jgi:hypothetical protein
MEHTISRQTDFQTNAILFHLFIQKNYYILQAELLDLTTEMSVRKKYGEILRRNAYSCTVE